MALAMIEGAERDGRLCAGPDGRRVHGRIDRLVAGVRLRGQGLPDADRRRPTRSRRRSCATMRAFGADAGGGAEPGGHHAAADPALMRERAFAIADEIGGFRTDQFQNHDMPTAITPWARRSSSNCDGRVDAWVCVCRHRRLLRAASAGRCASGSPASDAWRSSRPSRRCSRAASAGTHRIEGGGVGFRPRRCSNPRAGHRRGARRCLATEAEAFEMARRARARKGVWSGPSTGANLVAAVARGARRSDRATASITAAVDSGLKYARRDVLLPATVLRVTAEVPLWDTPGHVDPAAQLRVLRSRPAARERSGTHLHLRVHVLRRLRRGRFGGICPNCGGDLVRRPIRPPEKLLEHPAATERFTKAHPECVS